MLEVVVVGGGIAGATVALELVDRGAAVNVVDAEGVGGAATGASAGMLAPQYESAGPGPLFEMAVRSRDRYPTFVDRVEALSGRSLRLRRDGMLVANLTDAERRRAESDVEWQGSAGQRAEVIDADAARRLEPGLGSSAESYLWLAAEGQVDSQALAVALGEALAATDARVVTGRRVAALVSRGGRVTGVRLEDGRSLAADAVVVAAGAWSGELEGLPRTIPVRPVRGHMLRYPAGSAALGRLVATHAGRYLVPRSDGTVLAGSTMDEVGFDRSLSDAGLAAVARSAAELLPALADAEPVERWADLRPLSEDGLPILGPDPDLDGLVYATGYGRNGILLGPLAGRIAAGMVLGEGDESEWLAFSPARFTAPGAG
ncbi:MAG: glycine oxidase ThiO [Gemmatimonadetes bacterium]|nr:glycine oxidase ThiO [Gemmatimonadota bacterium]NIQ59007.1 glycine oxidase ThiO [Gemmatimonadota bacterium]NIU79214.1 glycine oxidase ThiO [Gammaproteobacteria bacterium]NIX47895.1 glycine oxidase ThiO [Gemmatimonadota bacterium]NIY12266.1 glycine oxidase ThiO [Gemmatimonadota bacterium]